MSQHISAGFESIAEMLLQQKKLMDELESENRALRRQIADLKRGVGISIVIDGKAMPLAGGNQGQESSIQSYQNASNGSFQKQQINSYQQNQQGSNSKQNDKRERENRTQLADSFVL